MARRLDHVVHAVADLDAAAAFYGRCGFQVGPRNRHPWGTHNRLVQFPDFFIEILTFAEPERLGEDGLSHHFGRFQQRAIARGEGLSMLLLASDDAQADAASFARAGIGTSQVLPFSREAVRADGSTTEVGFNLAFAHDPLSPRTGFAVCQHRNPAAFWNTAFQQHRNGAAKFAGMMLTAQRPRDHAGFLRALISGEMATDDTSVRALHGALNIMDERAFARRTGVSSPPSDGLELRGLRFDVARLAALEDILNSADIPSRKVNGSVVIPPEVAFGATLLFEEEGAR